jgi:serine/threonine protein kinase
MICRSDSLVSLAAVNLLQKILRKSPKDRATLDQIRSDPWISSMSFPPLISFEENTLSPDLTLTDDDVATSMVTATVLPRASISVRSLCHQIALVVSSLASRLCGFGGSNCNALAPRTHLNLYIYISISLSFLFFFSLSFGSKQTTIRQSREGRRSRAIEDFECAGSIDEVALQLEALGAPIPNASFAFPLLTPSHSPLRRELLMDPVSFRRTQSDQPSSPLRHSANCELVATDSTEEVFPDPSDGSDMASPRTPNRSPRKRGTSTLFTSMTSSNV